MTRAALMSRRQFARLAGFAAGSAALGSAALGVPLARAASFADVPAGSWYADYVSWASDAGVMTGYGNGLFGPDDGLTRGQVATILFRLSNPGSAATTDASQYGASSRFSDVAGGRYYTAAVEWCADAGVVTGYGDGRFGPEEYVTREQLATMLWRYSGSPAGSADISILPDSGGISSWAYEAVRWCAGEGIMTGAVEPTGVFFRPHSGATRAQASKMLAVMCGAAEGSSLPDSSGSRPKHTQYDIWSFSNASQGWMFGTWYDEYNRPTLCLDAQSRYGYLSAFCLGGWSPGEPNYLYLTMDEGYENGFTPSILDTLASRGVPCTFFLTGQFVQDEPGLVWRMINEGHTLGNHSVNHPAGGLPSLSIEGQRYEIMGLHDYVRDTFGYEMNLFRYPAGIYSEQSLALVNNLDYHSVFWSYAYVDWDPGDQPSYSYALNSALDRLHPGAVYLLHAVSETNAAILGEFIDKARQRGYEFRALQLW